MGHRRNRLDPPRPVRRLTGPELRPPRTHRHRTITRRRRLQQQRRGVPERPRRPAPRRRIGVHPRGTDARERRQGIRRWAQRPLLRSRPRRRVPGGHPAWRSRFRQARRRPHPQPVEPRRRSAAATGPRRLRGRRRLPDRQQRPPAGRLRRRAHRRTATHLPAGTRRLKPVGTAHVKGHPMLREKITLSLETVDTLVREENLGEAHIAVAAEPLWRNDEALAEARRLALDELRRTGLVSGGRAHPDLLAAIGLLCRSDREYFGWITAGDRSLSVLVAGTGNTAVLAVRTGDRLTLQPVPGDRLIEALVNRLPNMRPATGRSVTIHEDEVNGHTPRAGRDAPVWTGLDRDKSQSQALRSLNRILQLPRLGGGELYAAVRGRSGRRVKAPMGIGYIDTNEGRWTTHLTPERWIVAAPGSPQVVATRLQELSRLAQAQT
ncbi:ESX secretion-associated protein EspG [Pseudonocardiaceae bacterium YIM PH 21723]|nr:ESX secretion-associated protein EspG [Pseudonocardiaceae bacterium YIM PH 21723]